MSFKYFITVMRWLIQVIFPFLRAGWQPNKDQILSTATADDSIFITPVHSESASEYGLFYTHNDEPLVYSAEPALKFLAINILSLSDASVALSAGIVVTSTGKIIQETTFSRGKSSIRLEADPSKNKTVLLKGTSLSLASDYASGNYGHFILDSMSRLAVFLKDNNNALLECDHILVSGPKSRWKLKLLELFEVPIEKLIWLDNKSAFCCENIKVTSFIGTKQSYPFWLIDFLYPPIHAKYKLEKRKERRLFISRAGTVRNLKNEAALFLIAEKFGFEYYLPENSPDPIKDFYHAEAVIGAHGAGMTDIVFMKEASIVIELLPSDHKHCYFATLGKICKHQYYTLLGASDVNRFFGKQGPSPFDFKIDEEEFIALLNREFPCQVTRT